MHTRSITRIYAHNTKYAMTPGDVAIDDFAIIDLPSPVPTPAPSSPTPIPFPVPTEQPTHMPTPIPTLTLIPSPAPSQVPTIEPTPSPTVFESFFTILTTRNVVIGAAIFIAIIVVSAVSVLHYVLSSFRQTFALVSKIFHSKFHYEYRSFRVW